MEQKGNIMAGIRGESYWQFISEKGESKRQSQIEKDK